MCKGQALYGLGSICFKRHDLINAEKYLLESVKISNDFPIPYIGLAQFYLQTGKTSQSVEVVNQLIKKFGDDVLKRVPELFNLMKNQANTATTAKK